MDLVGQTLGQYRIVDPIGTGGMAAVYKAYQAGLDRYVAVKVLPSQHALTPGFKERFTREARAVAQLSHPNILPIYDFGIQDDLSYFVMKYVPDHTLSQLMGRPLALSRVSQLVDQVAGALDHAHERGILHRDIKPSNMLLEGDWLLLADFGLAKIVRGSQVLTATGATIGTPAYISPEQAEGKPVDQRTDIYSLGIVLYEMVTGRVPYEGETPMGVIFKHIFEPLPLPRHVNPDVPEKVERIILKAVAKNPAERYERAGDMAEALRQAVAERPGRAEIAPLPEPAPATVPEAPTLPPAPAPAAPSAPRRSMSQVLGRGGLALSGIGLLLLLAVGAFLFFGSKEDGPPPDPGAAVGDGGGVATHTPPSVVEPTELPTPVPSQPSGVVITADNVKRVEELFRLGRGTINAVAASPDGSRLAVAGSLGVWLYEAETLGVLRLLEGHTEPVVDVAWSPEGDRLVSAGQDDTLRVWDVVSGEPLQTLVGHVGIVASVAWSPDGALIASGGWDDTVRIWEAASGREQQVLASHTDAVLDVAWSPDGSQLASASRDGSLRLWIAADGRETKMLEGHASDVTSVAWSPDGVQLASAGNDETVRVWDAAAGAQRQLLEGHTSYVTGIAWSPDGTQIASSGLDRTVRVWDPVGGQQTQLLEGHTEPVRGVSWLSDGEELISGGDDGSLRVWDAASGSELRAAEGHGDAALSVAWSPDGTRLVMGYENGTLWIWSLDAGTSGTSPESSTRLLLHRLKGHTGQVNSLAWSPDGTQLASGGGTLDNRVLIWDPDTGGAPRVLDDHTGAVTSVAWSPDGSRLASAGWDNLARLWDATGRLMYTLEAHPDWVTSVAWSPDGSQLATGCKDGVVRIWSGEGGQLQQTLEGHTDQVTGVDWSPNGVQVASASWDDTVRVWSLLTKDGDARESLVLKTPGSVADVAWSPDGAYLATATSFLDNEARIWDASTGRELHTLQGHVDYVTSVVWSPDGTRLATAGKDGTVRVWGVSTGR